MPKSNDEQGFNFIFDPMLEEYGDFETMDDGPDPGIFLPNIEGRTEFLPPDVENMPVIPNVVDRNAPEYAQRPAEERTRELFAHMAPHRQVLYGVLREALNPCSDTRMEEVIAELRAYKFSVYSPANICTMLEQAGALDRVTEDGELYDSHTPTPRIEMIDGEEYWVPTEPPEVFWQTSEAGKAALEAYDPRDRMLRQLEREEDFASIYKRVLTLASAEEGTSMAKLSAAVDSNPLIAKPRRFFVQHFVEALERCECVAWRKGAWHITELGSEILEQELADVEMEEVGDDAEVAPAHLPTETQGLNW